MAPPIFRLFGVIVLLLAGCGDEQPRKQTGEKRSGLTTSEIQPSWLDVHDDIAPDAWLIEREKSAGQTISDADAQSLRQSLQRAAATFKESPRMIVNRALQLEAMLKPVDEGDTAISLIARLTDAAGGATRAEGFAAIGQHYYNMRKAGISAGQALDGLSQRSGSRG